MSQKGATPGWVDVKVSVFSFTNADKTYENLSTVKIFLSGAVIYILAHDVQIYHVHMHIYPFIVNFKLNDMNTTSILIKIEETYS